LLALLGATEGPAVIQRLGEKSRAQHFMKLTGFQVDRAGDGALAALPLAASDGDRLALAAGVEVRVPRFYRPAWGRRTTAVGRHRRLLGAEDRPAGIRLVTAADHGEARERERKPP
jgi:hypothetical protein